MFKKRNLLEFMLLIAGGSALVAMSAMKKLAKANFACHNKVDQDPLISNDIEVDRSMTWKKLIKQCKNLHAKNKFLADDNKDLQTLNQRQANRLARIQDAVHSAYQN